MKRLYSPLNSRAFQFSIPGMCNVSNSSVSWESDVCLSLNVHSLLLCTVRLNSPVLLSNIVFSAWQNVEGVGNLSSAPELSFSVGLGSDLTALLHCFPSL